MENTIIKGTAWSGAEKKRLREIMSDKSRSRDKNLKIASEELNRTTNACSWQWYMTTARGKRLYAKKRGKRATAIVEKTAAQPIPATKLAKAINEADRLPVVSIMRNQQLLRVNCLGGTKGTTIYKADDLLIIVDTNN